MILGKIMNEELINLKLEASSKLDVITIIGENLKKYNRILDLDEFIKDVYKREEMESTNLVLGIAIPHCKSSNNNDSSVSLVKLVNEVDWEDGKEKVKIVFLLSVSPNQEGITHLEVIAGIATLLMEEEFKELLEHSENSTDILHYISKELGGE